MSYEKTHRESVENYLKKILELSERKQRIRSVDLASAIGFSKASVSVAVKKMQAEQLIRLDEKGLIFLTEDGFEIAHRILDRHRFFTTLLKSAGIDAETAEKEACCIEHVVSDNSFDKLQKYYG